MKRKIISLVVVLIVMFTALSMSCFAAESISFIYDNTPPQVQARFIPECGSYATHDMLSHGWGDIVRTSTGATVVKNGACHQCTRCHLVVICQGEPLSGKALGYWSTWQPNEPLTSTITVLNTNNISYASGGSIPGITFRYS